MLTPSRHTTLYIFYGLLRRLLLLPSLVYCVLVNRVSHRKIDMTHSCFVSLWTDAVSFGALLLHIHYPLFHFPSTHSPPSNHRNDIVCDAIVSQHAMHTTEQTLAPTTNTHAVVHAASDMASHTRHDSTEGQGCGNRHCHACAPT